jgi:hypothetical protein
MILNKEIVIYWSYTDKYQIRAEEPVPMVNNYLKKKVPEEYDYMWCPSFIEYFKNTYCLKSLFDYKLKFENNGITSNMHDQTFYNEIVNLRNYNSRMASFAFPYIFIAECDDLEMEYMPSMMENNSFNNTAILIPGQMNIGKYVRPLDCGFHAKKDEVEIKEDDIYAYVKFKTNKKIVFKRFLWDEELQKEIRSLQITKYRKHFKPLDWYYKKQQAMKVKERTIKLINNNLL